ncbi:MAG: hypothetical protein H6579_10390 [Chitinophagales bacterium]|nr:hypothetical protein [Bacteroidota bacterium]MCB9257529.1 hypothetical protein [Chitinophagales bacterium]
MRFYTLSSFLLLVNLLFAGGETQVIGAKQAGMAFTGVCEIDEYSSFNNAAASAFLEIPSLSFYAANHFLLPELNRLSSAFTYPNKKLGSFSINYTFWGYKAYQESKLAFAYARKFGKIFSTGLSFNYNRLSIIDNGSKNLFSLNIDLFCQLSEKLRLGMHIINPARQKLNKQNKETLASQIHFGLRYEAHPKFILCLEMQKDLQYPLLIKLACNYIIDPKFQLRFGAASMPTYFTLGIGSQFKNLKMDLASTWNLQLGYAPQFSLSYLFHKDKNDENN